MILNHLLGQITAQQVHDMREETGDGLGICKRRLTQQALIAATSVAQTVDDLRDILLYMLHRESD